MTAAPAADLRAAIYLRISRDPKDTRKGVVRQHKDCMSLAAELGWPVIDTYDENNTSATRAKTRREFQRLIGDIHAGRINAVLFWEFDRYTRDPVEADQLGTMARDLGLRAASTSGGEMDLLSPKGRRDLVVQGADARKETDQMSKRLRAAFAQKAAAGEPHGAVPYGWLRVKEYDQRGNVISSRDELHPDQAPLLQDCARRLLAGESLRSVVAGLTAAGKLTPRGTAWSSATLRQVLLRERNAGLRRHRGQVIGAGQWPALYDQGTHDRVVALLTDAGRRTNKGATRRHLLTGIARCGREGCEGTMVVNVGRRVADGSKHQPPAYTCAVCTRVRRKQDDVDKVVRELMVARLERPDALDALMAGDKATVAAARDRVAALEAKLDRLADQAADDVITERQLGRITARLLPQLEEAKRLRDAAVPANLPADMAGPGAEARWDAAPLDVRRALIEALVTVTVMPQGPGRSFDRNLIRVEPRHDE